MNKAILIGNLTRDPELRTTSTGINVCTFSIAVNRRIPNAQGVREADFFNIVAWRGLADLCAKFLSKGRKVAVVGQIQNRSYDAQDGTKRNVTEIVADDVEFLNTPTGGQAHADGDVPLPPAPPAPRMPAASPAPAPAFGGETGFTQVDDDELPF